MKFNDFTRPQTLAEKELSRMYVQLKTIDKKSTDYLLLLQAIENLELSTHRVRVLNNNNNQGVSMNTNLEIARLAKRAKYVERLIAEGHDGEELMELDLATLRDMVDALEIVFIVQIYANANGTVSRKVTERKAA